MDSTTFEALKRIMHHTVNGGANDKAFWDDVKTIERFIEEFPNYLYSAWHIDDVKQQDSSLTDEEAREILQSIDHNHDATIGINWDVIDAAIEMYKQDR